MKSIHKAHAAAAAALLILLAAPGRAGIVATPGGSLYIEGDSTLHVWRSTATQIALTFRTADGAPASLADAIKAAKVDGLEVRIALSGMRSGENGLDKNMRAAMEAGKFPDIAYKLGKYELVKGDGDALTAKTEGELTIHGRTRPVPMDVEFAFGPGGVELKGRRTLLMSDYGVKPPTLMFGAIKVKDPVTVYFDLFVKPDAPKAQSN